MYHANFRLCTIRNSYDNTNIDKNILNLFYQTKKNHLCAKKWIYSGIILQKTYLTHKEMHFVHN